MIEGLTRLFTGYLDYAAVPESPHGYLPGLGRWFVVFTPVVAGLLYGPLVYRFAREARGNGVPEVMLAVARHGGRIRPQVAVVKALASGLCIAGAGRSVGRVRSCRSALRSVLRWPSSSTWMNAGFDFWWRAGRRAGTRPPSTRRWLGSSSRWN